MSDINVKLKVAAVLGLPDVTDWAIIDADKETGLALAHYDETKANMSKYGHIRGVVVDYNKGVVVCSSFGYTPTCTLDKIVPQFTGNLELTDEHANQHTFLKDNYFFRIGFEGVIIRVFKFDGKTYRSSHKRLDPSGSRWGTSDTFIEIYDRLQGPDPNTLFNPKAKYSPWVHSFLLVDKKLLVGTKQDVGTGYIVHINSERMWSKENCPYPVEEVDDEMAVINSTPYMPECGKIDKPFIFKPTDMNIAEANEHLALGFWGPIDIPDPRLSTGEFLVLYQKDEKSGVRPYFKVMSPAYRWRTLLRDDNQNIKHQFYFLLNDSYLETKTKSRQRGIGKAAFKEKYIIFNLYAPNGIVQHIEQHGMLMKLDVPGKGVNIDNLYNTPDLRFQQIWMNYLLSVPFTDQAEVATFYFSLLQDRLSVISWIQAMSTDGELENNDDIPDRVKSIVASARNMAIDKIGVVKDDAKSRVTFVGTVKEIIRNLLFKESGQSLYNLVKKKKLLETKKESKEEVTQ